MKTRCPDCGAPYHIEPELLLGSDGRARCYRCGAVFDVALRAKKAEATPKGTAAPLLVRADEAQDEPPPDGAAPAPQDSAEPAKELPFGVPENLEPLQVSREAALDVSDTLYEKRSRRGLVYGWLAALLLLGLGLQLAWQYRQQLLADYPFLAPVCEHLPCFDPVTHEPDRFRVMQRAIRPAANQPGALTLDAAIRNDAHAAQALPDIQLSLVDIEGKVLIRRSLSPRDYLFPPPEPGTLVAPGEVITIVVDFKDPGSRATGFLIDFH